MVTDWKIGAGNPLQVRCSYFAFVQVPHRFEVKSWPELQGHGETADVVVDDVGSVRPRLGARRIAVRSRTDGPIGAGLDVDPAGVRTSSLVAPAPAGGGAAAGGVAVTVTVEVTGATAGAEPATVSVTVLASGAGVAAVPLTVVPW